MTKVSVVCCFYNRPQAVRPTLYGLKNQTLEDFEAIIADDGSSDETAAVLREVLAEMNDPRFRLVTREKNIGLTRGLIEGVRQAKSPYVAIHDAGDVSLPRRLEAQAGLLDAEPEVVVVGSHYVNYIEAMNLYRVRTPDAGSKSAEDLIDDTTFTHGEVMFRRAAYEKAGGYRAEFRMSQDNDLWLRMRHLGRFGTVPEPLYIRAVDFGGISFNPATVARQSAYYMLGKKIARGTVDETEVLSRLAAGEAITDVLPIDDPDVQKQLSKVAIRSALFGSPEAGRQIARDYLVPSPRNRMIRTGLGLLAAPWGGPALAQLRKAMGVKSGRPEGWPKASVAP
jgi:glycosyltransferase involved in cell wall biosynthesis